MKNKNNSGKKLLTKKDIMSAFLILLGILPGIICYSRLPEMLPINFSIDNKVNLLASKGFVLFVMPLVMMLYHIFLCAVINYIDQGNIPKGIKITVRHAVPILAITMEVSIVMFALDIFKNIGLVICTAIGLLLICYGNYLPKTRCISSKKFKLPKLFTDESIWSGFSRFAGWFVLLCGVLVIIFAFLSMMYVCIGILIISPAIPVIYAFIANDKASN